MCSNCEWERGINIHIHIQLDSGRKIRNQDNSSSSQCIEARQQIVTSIKVKVTIYNYSFTDITHVYVLSIDDVNLSNINPSYPDVIAKSFPAFISSKKPKVILHSAPPVMRNFVKWLPRKRHWDISSKFSDFPNVQWEEHSFHTHIYNQSTFNY